MKDSMKDERKSASTAKGGSAPKASEFIKESKNIETAHEVGQQKNDEPRRELGKEFISPFPWKGESKADTLVIHCSDHRFQDHFGAFVDALPTEPDVLAIPGGPHVLIAASYIEKFEWVGRRWVKFLLDSHNLRRIICVAHEDCGWYKNISIGGFTLPVLKDRQVSDLKKIKLVLHDMFPKVESEAWYVDVDGNHVRFFKIT